jgi:hypothetical protein
LTFGTAHIFSGGFWTTTRFCQALEQRSLQGSCEHVASLVSPLLCQNRLLDIVHRSLTGLDPGAPARRSGCQVGPSAVHLEDSHALSVRPAYRLAGWVCSQLCFWRDRTVRQTKAPQVASLLRGHPLHRLSLRLASSHPGPPLQQEYGAQSAPLGLNRDCMLAFGPQGGCSLVYCTPGKTPSLLAGG